MSQTTQTASEFTNQNWLTLIGMIVVAVGWWANHWLTQWREGRIRSLNVNKPVDVEIDYLRQVKDLGKWQKNYIFKRKLNDEQQFQLREFLDIFREVESLRNLKMSAIYNSALNNLLRFIGQWTKDKLKFVYHKSKRVPWINTDLFSPQSYRLCFA